jgi:molybdopterin synthase sulfur carrier subunit
MKVKIKFFATLRENGDKEADTVDMPVGATVRDLLEKHAIGLAEVGILIINNKDATFDQLLTAGDSVTIIPPIGGG